jgi:glycosyltransferase involved in cell wall biosynthesis
MVRVGIFIPVYRESKHLEPLLHALIEDPYPDKRIVVCIDEPTDETRELIAAMGNLSSST